LLCGAPDEALVTGARALEIARRAGDARLRILTTTFLEQSYYHLGDYARAVELAAENLAALPPEWTYERLGGTVALAIIDRFFLITGLAELGRFSEGTSREAEVIRLAEPMDHPHSLAIAYEAAGMLRLLMTDWARARFLFEDGIVAARRGNLINQTTHLLASSAWALAQLGDGGKALERLQESEQLVESRLSRGFLGRLGWGYYVLGSAYLTLGRLDEAKRFGNLAVRSSPRHPGFAARGLQLLADVAAHDETFDYHASEASYRAALGLAEPRGMRPLVAHCHRGLAKLYQRSGDRRKTRLHLARATSLYGDMGVGIFE